MSDDGAGAIVSEPNAGLSSEEAALRLSAKSTAPQSGLPHPSLRTYLVESFRNPFHLILISAATASALLGQQVDALVIATIILISGIIELRQKLLSEKALANLRAEIARTATVLRDGVWQELPRTNIVVGDRIRVAAGDLIPADCRLVLARDLFVQQSALSGESLPAEKAVSLQSENIPLTLETPGYIFLGTSVVSGTGEGIVIAVDRDTTFGEILNRLSESPLPSEFDRGLKAFSILMTRFILGIVSLTLIANILLERDPIEALLFAIALAIGLTPEFLPMITTVTLTHGALQLAKKKVLVKHLSAIQNLGSIDILCSDKTGTLTLGNMTVDGSFDPHGTPSSRALELASLNSEFETGIRSPIDAAILAAHSPETAHIKGVDEIPFDFERRRLSIVIEADAQRMLITKGAPESILEVSSHLEIRGEILPLTNGEREQITRFYQELNQKGHRVIAVGYRTTPIDQSHFSKHDEHSLITVGFISLADPILPTAHETVAALKRDGVRLLLLTGDNELIAQHICTQAGISGDRLVLGSELEKLSDSELQHLLAEAQVFARLAPAQKHRIVKLLQRQGHVVGFIGDGVNDAPSLHAADVGIAPMNATDIACEAADLVLLERDLRVLHEGILAGRASFGNVLKFLLMETSSNFGNVLSMAIASLLLPFLPLLPTQILLNAFLYNIAQLSIPTDRVDEIFIRRPHRWNMSLVQRFMVTLGPISSVYDFLTFGAMLFLFHFDEAHFRSGWFVESLVTQTLVLLVIRTAGRSWRHRPSTALLVTTLGISAIALVLPFTMLGSLVALPPLPGQYYAFLLCAVVTYLVIVEAVKRAILSRDFFRGPPKEGNSSAS